MAGVKAALWFVLGEIVPGPPRPSAAPPPPPILLYAPIAAWLHSPTPHTEHARAWGRIAGWQSSDVQPLAGCHASWSSGAVDHLGLGRQIRHAHTNGSMNRRGASSCRRCLSSISTSFLDPVGVNPGPLPGFGDVVEWVQRRGLLRCPRTEGPASPVPAQLRPVRARRFLCESLWSFFRSVPLAPRRHQVRFCWTSGNTGSTQAGCST